LGTHFGKLVTVPRAFSSAYRLDRVARMADEELGHAEEGAEEEEDEDT
jgi:hypothetical protein